MVRLLPRASEFIGELFGADGKTPTPVVVTLGGSSGGLGMARDFACRFHGAGIAALAVAYFGAPGLPDQLRNIPLEYFFQIIDWITSIPAIDSRKIALAGMSKGAEAALLVAAHDKRIGAVIAADPSAVAWQGLDRHGNPVPGPSWTIDGREIPYIAYDASGPKGGDLAWHVSSLASATNSHLAAIPVEAIQGPLLLVSGSDDRIWPSGAMAKRIVDRLSARGHGTSVTTLNYESAGHAFFAMPSDDKEVTALDMLGGTFAANRVAQSDAWLKSCAFLKQVWKARR